MLPRVDVAGAIICSRLQGRKHEAGSVARAPALEIEVRVAEAVRAARPPPRAGSAWRISRRRAATARQPIRERCARATTTQLTRRHRACRHLSNDNRDELAEGMASVDQSYPDHPRTLPSPHRRGEVIQGEGDSASAMRPMSTEARALVMDALRDAHHWLDELIWFRPNHRIAGRARRQN